MTSPQNVLVAEFFGSPPMNLVRGTLKQDRDWLLFSEVEDGTIEVRLPISEFPADKTLWASRFCSGFDRKKSEVARIIERRKNIRAVFRRS